MKDAYFRAILTEKNNLKGNTPYDAQAKDFIADIAKRR